MTQPILITAPEAAWAQSVTRLSRTFDNAACPFGPWSDLKMTALIHCVQSARRL